MRRSRQVSAGGVVFRLLRGRPVIALCRRWGGRVWCLPKGHIDPGETSEQAALREVREEAGLDAVILDGLGEIAYEFTETRGPGPPRRIAKRVRFFLMRRTGGNIRDHDDEVEGVRYFPLDEAARKATFPGERRLIRKGVTRIRRGLRSRRDRP